MVYIGCEFEFVSKFWISPSKIQYPVTSIFHNLQAKLFCMKRSSIKLKAILRKIFQYFFQGIIIIAPISVTIFIVVWLFDTIDGILPGIINRIFPPAASGKENIILRIPGIGFIIVIFFTILIGRISSSFFVARIIDFLGHLLERTPGVKLIYSSVKDFLEAFAGNKKKFNKPVLVNVDGPDVWRIGFITQTDLSHFDLTHHFVVYVPHAYALSGITYFVPRERVKLLENIAPADAMKFTVSGGVTEVE